MNVRRYYSSKDFTVSLGKGYGFQWWPRCTGLSYVDGTFCWLWLHAIFLVTISASREVTLRRPAVTFVNIVFHGKEFELCQTKRFKVIFPEHWFLAQHLSTDNVQLKAVVICKQTFHNFFKNWSCYRVTATHLKKRLGTVFNKNKRKKSSWVCITSRFLS